MPGGKVNENIGLEGPKRDSEMKPNAAASRLRLTLLKS